MENYTFNGKCYIANEGYQFVNKETGYSSIMMYLAENDSIDNYEIQAKPEIIEEVITEIKEVSEQYE